MLDTIKATAIINDLIDQIVSLIKIGPHICERVSFARIREADVIEVCVTAVDDICSLAEVVHSQQGASVICLPCLLNLVHIGQPSEEETSQHCMHDPVEAGARCDSTLLALGLVFNDDADCLNTAGRSETLDL